MLALRDGWFVLHEGRNHRCGLELLLQFAAIIQELLTPASIVIQDFMELSVSGNEHDALVEFTGWAKPFGIPGRDLSEHAAGQFFAKDPIWVIAGQCD